MSSSSLPLAHEAEPPLATPSFYDRIKQHPDAMRAFESNAQERALMKPEQAQQHVAQQWAPVFKRYELTNEDARHLVEVDTLAHGKAPDAATREKWAGEAKAALLATYGPSGAGQALADARAFVRQDRQLAALAGRGFGDHKALVLVAARLGSAARKAGRLK